MDDIKKFIDKQIEQTHRCVSYCLNSEKEETAKSFMKDLKILYTLLLMVEEKECG